MRAKLTRGSARDKLQPPHSRQAEWIEAHLRELEARANVPPAPAPSSGWLTKAGPVAVLLFALTKGKALLAIFNMKFLLSLGAFLGVYWSLYGWKFGLGFTVSILIHELGHYIDIKRRGLPVDMPVFLPGLGAFVRWQALGVSKVTRAEVSLAGPLAGWFAAAACAAMWFKTGDGLWAALARTGAWLNVMNLIPVWALDGGQAFGALSKAQRAVILAACLLLLFFTHAEGHAEGVFFLVALGAGWRLFTKDLPQDPSAAVTAYFAALLAGFAFLMWMLPVANGLP